MDEEMSDAYLPVFINSKHNLAPGWALGLFSPGGMPPSKPSLNDDKWVLVWERFDLPSDSWDVAVAVVVDDDDDDIGIPEFDPKS